MPYLQAVIKEGLRLKAPAAGLFSRVTPQGGDTLSGYYVPEYTQVGINLFGLFSDPKLWGNDVKMFRPERFLVGTPQDIRKREVNLELVFSYGKWQCLGRNVAMMELNKVFVEVSSPLPSLLDWARYLYGISG